MKPTLVAAVLVLVLAGAASLAPAATTHVPSLRHAIIWHRARTWRWQDRAGVPRTRSAHVERRSSSPAFLRWVARLWSRRRVVAHRRYVSVERSRSGSIPAIICRVFGSSRCPEAKSIAWTESKWSTHPYPPNPTHFGIFQLDASAIASYARGRYSTAYEQVEAAFRMYLARGWEPWTCCEG
jgi:hypothetical protein